VNTIRGRWFPELSGEMRVKVRAAIVHEGALVVVSGRIDRSETVLDALVREVAEETGLDVVAGDLLYVAEVTPRHGPQDLNVIFSARLEDARQLGGGEHPPGVGLLDLDAEEHPLLLPPLLEDIRRDAAAEWRTTPRWLGNVWLEHVESSPETA
jgi:8-oxo-dGTP pyrophosphatase MutT (NUDIX family)